MTANLVRLSWHAAYEFGNPVIDEQHRGLFVDANNLLGAVLSVCPEAEVAALVNTLVKHFHDGTLSIGELFQFLARDVVARHMLGADREFFACLQPKPRP